MRHLILLGLVASALTWGAHVLSWPAFGVIAALLTGAAALAVGRGRAGIRFTRELEETPAVTVQLPQS